MDTMKKGKFTATIEQDEFPSNPRENDNLGTMICIHRNYRIGDEHEFKSAAEFFKSLWSEHATDEERRKFVFDHCKDKDEAEKDIEKFGLDSTFDYFAEINVEGFVNEFPEAVVHLPVYLYDHSGLSVNTTGFHCRWDSGLLGFIYISREKIKEEYGKKPPSDEKIREYLKNEVEEVNQMLTGDVYTVSVKDKDGEVIDSCSGFFGLKYAKEEAARMLEESVKLDEENRHPYESGKY